VQALRLCTGRTAQRGSTGVALLFHDQRHYKGVRGQRHAPAALYPRERAGTHCTGGWAGPTAGLDRCGKSHPHRDSIPGPSSPWPVAIPTTLPGWYITNYFSAFRSKRVHFEIQKRFDCFILLGFQSCSQRFYKYRTCHKIVNVFSQEECSQNNTVCK